MAMVNGKLYSALYSVCLDDPSFLSDNEGLFIHYLASDRAFFDGFEISTRLLHNVVLDLEALVKVERESLEVNKLTSYVNSFNDPSHQVVARFKSMNFGDFELILKTKGEYNLSNAQLILRFAHIFRQIKHMSEIHEPGYTYISVRFGNSFVHKCITIK